MKEFFVLLVGAGIGYLGHPYVQTWLAEQHAPQEEVASEPALEPVPDYKPVVTNTPRPKYVSPLEKGAYDKRSGVASAPRYYYAAPVSNPTFTPSPTPTPRPLR